MIFNLKFIKMKIFDLQINKWIFWASMVLLGGMALLFIFHPAPPDRILNIQNYLITTGGIIAAVVIAYLSSKIFNLRSERSIAQVQIDEISQKVTLFRRLLFYILSSDQYWNKHEDIKYFIRRYPNLDFHKYHDHNNEEAVQAHENEKSKSLTSIDLYLAMLAISGPIEQPGRPYPWQLDKSLTFRYSPQDLIDMLEPTNQIWYYLDYKYIKHCTGLFNDTAVSPLYTDDVNSVLAAIDPKFLGRNLDRHILSEIASEFHGNIIPTIVRKISRNVGIPKALLGLFTSLVFIIFVSVIFPLGIQAINISENLNVALTLFLVWLTTVGLLVFLILFYKFLVEDIHLGNK